MLYPHGFLALAASFSGKSEKAAAGPRFALLRRRSIFSRFADGSWMKTDRTNPRKSRVTTDVDEIDDRDVKDRRLCSRCVGEPFLRAEIQKVGTEAVCDYCDKKGITISIDEMADHIETAFEHHYQLTANEPSALEYAMMKEGDYDWEREGNIVFYVIGDAARLDNAAPEDIRQVLEGRHSDFERDQMGEEGPFDEAAFYKRKEVDDSKFIEAWRHFEKSLKTEARFFNTTITETLDNVFEELADHKVHEGGSIIVSAGPGTKIPAFFRARVFQSEEKLEEALKRPDLEIGPPPPRAAMAGRMNARGISVFYGAIDQATAVAEVRPPVGSRIAVGRFELLRKVRLLDVNALRSVYVEGSIFDKSYVDRLARAKFLERLSTMITTPVMPDDEPLDYLVTQTIAEYLANRSEPALDGILYLSVQGLHGGANVVLFHKSALVAPMELPPDTKLEAQSGHWTDDGWECDYLVWEEIPAKEPKGADEEPIWGSDVHALMVDPIASNRDAREPALRLDLKSVEVHQVTAVQFETTAFPVKRHRFEKRERKF